MKNKRKAILLVGALLCLNLNIFSQNIPLKMNKVSVKKAMTELKEKSGYSFVYIAGDLDTKKIVDIDAVSNCKKLLSKSWKDKMFLMR